MHKFSDIIEACTAFGLSALRERNEQIVEALQTSASTRLVVALQMVQMQKAIMAVGMFSMFEASLQDSLNCEDGFARAAAVLDSEGQTALAGEFSDYRMAINVLKHGRGRSYDALVAKVSSLPFRVKNPTEAFFSEGDVSEISTLIEVDDKFVLDCARIIQEVAAVIRSAR